MPGKIGTLNKEPRKKVKGKSETWDEKNGLQISFCTTKQKFFWRNVCSIWANQPTILLENVNIAKMLTLMWTHCNRTETTDYFI